MLDMKRIDAITYDIEAHLRKLESFIGILKEVKESILFEFAISHLDFSGY